MYWWENGGRGGRKLISVYSLSQQQATVHITNFIMIIIIIYNNAVMTLSGYTVYAGQIASYFFSAQISK